MKKLLMIWMIPAMMQAQTLEECQQAAERNYPLVRQYDLISRTSQLTVSNISKGWLPQVSATAQATLQSDVMAWPDQMQTMLSTMGIDLKGLRRDQYRVGIDVQQTVYDGGAIRSQQQIARRQSDVQAAQTETELYQVHRRVNEMYFGMLLLDEQIRLNHDLQTLLAANEQKLAAMYKGGTASESDHLSVKAELLNARQQLTSLQSQRSALSVLLSAFCGLEVKAPSKPVPYAAAASQSAVLRPELQALDAQLRLADAQEQALHAALMPRLSLFAQGYYGYPGYNMFEDMLHHRWTLNGLVGARLTWNIGALYTRRNDKAKIDSHRDMVNVQRDVFLFNNRLEQLQQDENISRYRKLMADDDEIITLRQSVRRSAESKLAHGIISVNDLVREINAENAARVQQSMHELEMLKEMYNLKYSKGEGVKR